MWRVGSITYNYDDWTVKIRCHLPMSPLDFQYRRCVYRNKDGAGEMVLEGIKWKFSATDGDAEYKAEAKEGRSSSMTCLIHESALNSFWIFTKCERTTMRDSNPTPFFLKYLT